MCVPPAKVLVRKCFKKNSVRILLLSYAQHNMRFDRGKYKRFLIFQHRVLIYTPIAALGAFMIHAIYRIIYYSSLKTFAV